VGNVTVESPKRQHQKRRAVADASGSSHPLKKLREDHKTSSEAATGGKSPSVLGELLASRILNVEAGVEAVVNLPLVTSSVSATPEGESGVPTNSVTGLNFRTISPSERFVISSGSSHHSSINAAEAGMTLLLVPRLFLWFQHSIFHDSSSAGTIKPDVAGSSHITRKELSMGSRDINSETLHEVFVSQWNISNDTLLHDHDVSREFIDHLAPPVLFAQIREMDYHHLFTKFNVKTARQACLNAKVRMGTEYCLSERKRLESKCESQANLLKAKDVEIENLKAQLLLKEAEAAEAARLRIQVSAVEAAEKVHADELNALKQKSVALEDERDSLNGKITELQSSVSAKDLEL
ncbi:hypothetical protein Tco_0049603, partial [Tanacetum coccineum]